MRMEVTLHPGQQRAQDSQAKVIAVIAGTGGGKTSYAPLWAFTEWVKLRDQGKQEIKILVVAPYKILKTTTMPAFLRLFETKLRLGSWESRADGIWRFSGNHGSGYVYFRSADTAESIEGAHVHMAILDEAGQRQFSEETFRAVERRVRFHQGRILITTTPYVLGWLKVLADASKMPPRDKRGRKNAAARPDVEVITFPSIANPKFPEDEFERARATLPPWMFRMFYLGEWDRPAGLVYSMLRDEHWIEFSEMPKGWERWPGYAGVDFGYNNPHAQIYGSLSPENVLYVFDEYYQTEKTNHDLARSAPHKEKVAMAWGDPAAPEAIAEFVQQRWHITACPRHEVLDGLREVFERLATGRLIFVRGRLTELAKELDSYVWDAEHPDKVIKLHDHGADALRMLCQGLRSIGQSLPDQPISPGRMGSWALAASSLEEEAIRVAASAFSPSGSMHLGSRSLGSRLAGLPRSIVRRR